MKSIAVVYLGRKGGGALYSYEMAKGLIENGYNVYAFISQGVENIEKWMELKTEGTEVISTYDSEISFIFNSIIFRLFKYSKLRKKYANVQIDACYIPMGHPWTSYIINIFKKAQVIDTLHDPIAHSTNRPIYRKIVEFGSMIATLGVKKRKPNDIVILSEVFRDYVCQNYQMPSEHVHVIPHGVFDYYKKIDTEKKYSYSKNKVNFLFFGRICAYKGLEVLAEAFRIVQKQCAETTLTIVGSGDFSPYKDCYKDLNDVTLVNRWIPDEEVASYFRSDEKLILVLPYIDATQSGVIPIAMSCGIPVIASNTGGLAEQIEDGVTGILCKPNDAEDLASHMLNSMYADNSEMISNAKAFIDTLSWDVLSEKIGRLID